MNEHQYNNNSENRIEDAPKEKSPFVSLPVSILAAAILVSGAIVYSANQGDVAPAPAAGDAAGQGQAGKITIPALNDRDVVMGDKNAKVTLVEYGDYKCFFCGKFFSEIEPELIDDYVKTGKVKLVYRDLAILGEESTLAAEAGECSKDQNKFWQFHDAIYMEKLKSEDGKITFTKDLFVKLAKQVGMDADKFTACYDGQKYTKLVAAQVKQALDMGINSTPTSFVFKSTSKPTSFVDGKEENGNGQEIPGAQPYPTFSAAIDALLNK